MFKEFRYSENTDKVLSQCPLLFTGSSKDYKNGLMVDLSLKKKKKKKKKKQLKRTTTKGISKLQNYAGLYESLYATFLFVCLVYSEFYFETIMTDHNKSNCVGRSSRDRLEFPRI